MAEQKVYTGGGRRSTAQTYMPREVVGTGATVYDEELNKQLLDAIAQVAAPVATTTAQAPVGLEELLGSGSSIADFEAPSGPGADPANQMNPKTGVELAKTLSILGQLSGTPELGMAGGMVGTGSAAAGQQSRERQLGTFLQGAASLAGVPNVGLVSNVARGNVSGLLDMALYAANPVLGLVNSLQSLFTDKSAGTNLVGAVKNAQAAAEFESSRESDAALGLVNDVERATGIAGIGLSDISRQMFDGIDIGSYAADTGGTAAKTSGDTASDSSAPADTASDFNSFESAYGY